MTTTQARAELDQLLGYLRPQVGGSIAVGWGAVRAPAERCAELDAECMQVAGDVQTVFDLASLTKSVTALAVLAAGMHVDAPLARYLPELRGSWGGAATIGALLAHRSGLSGHVPLYAQLRAGQPFVHAAAIQTAAAAVAADRSTQQGGAPFDALYSDCGYLLLGVALARVHGVAAFDVGPALRELVLAPLGLDAQIGAAPQFAAASIAATEVCALRGGLVRGVVHDENAWVLTGAGVSGHAGLFGRAAGVLQFALAVEAARRGEPGVLNAAHVAYLLQPRAGGAMRAGFDGKSALGSSAGTRASAGAYGHLGFTGTSYWVCPERGAAVVALTNRVHPARDNPIMKTARPQLHDALYACIDAQFGG